jgi:hypothetical protein
LIRVVAYLFPREATGISRDKPPAYFAADNKFQISFHQKLGNSDKNSTGRTRCRNDFDLCSKFMVLLYISFKLQNEAELRKSKKIL